MARYDYVCAECGIFETVRSIGTAAATERCPGCGRAASRVYSPPALISPGSPLRRAREAADRSAHEPVVTGAPPALPRTRTLDPLHAKLPRP